MSAFPRSDRSCAIDAPTAARSTTSTRASKFGTFAITFGITFAILYTVFERLNWPLFTYHPAVGKLDFWMQRARSGEGPPMYWYGWLALSLPGALVLGWIATMISGRWLHRATIFCCVLAVLWPATFAFAAFIADQASFDAEFLKSMWISAIPALVGAAAASYFVTLPMGATCLGRLVVDHADRRTRRPRLLAQAVLSAVAMCPTTRRVVEDLR